MQKILVVQTWGIGDMVLTTPMLHALRIACPNAHITVVAGSDAAAEVIRGARFCDDIRIMSFRRSSLPAIVRFFFQLRMQRFDAAFIASRLSPTVALLLRFLSGIHTVVGDGTDPRGWGYSDWRRVDVARHKVVENLEIIKLRFPKVETGELYFQIDDEARREAERIWSDHKLDECAVLGIHPGGGASECPDKQIPREVCRAIVREFLAGASSRRVVMFFGPDEVDLMPAYEWGLDGVVLLAGLRLAVVGAAIARCRKFLAGDTGLGHIAAAVGTPVVTLAGPTDIDHTRPWGQAHRIVRTEKPLTCMPCYETALYGNCPSNQECMRSISAGEVSCELKDLASQVSANPMSRQN